MYNPGFITFPQSPSLSNTRCLKHLGVTFNFSSVVKLTHPTQQQFLLGENSVWGSCFYTCPKQMCYLRTCFSWIFTYKAEKIQIESSPRAFLCVRAKDQSQLGMLTVWLLLLMSLRSLFQFFVGIKEAGRITCYLVSTIKSHKLQSLAVQIVRMEF